MGVVGLGPGAPPVIPSGAPGLVVTVVPPSVAGVVGGRHGAARGLGGAAGRAAQVKDSSPGEVEELVRVDYRQIGVGRARGHGKPHQRQVRAGNDGREQSDTLWVVERRVPGVQQDCDGVAAAHVGAGLHGAGEAALQR